jgi:hypothetical protein
MISLIKKYLKNRITQKNRKCIYPFCSKTEKLQHGLCKYHFNLYLDSYIFIIEDWIREECRKRIIIS